MHTPRPGFAGRSMVLPTYLRVRGIGDRDPTGHAPALGHGRKRPCSRFMPTTYLILIAPGPLTLIRAPLRGRHAGGRTDEGELTWYVLRKALTPIMHAYGLRAKDIHAIEGVDNSDHARQAFEGGQTYTWFTLWDWTGEQFEQVRGPINGT